MLENGVYLAPSQFEAGFLSIAHGNAEIDATIETAQRAFRIVSHGSRKGISPTVPVT